MNVAKTGVDGGGVDLNFPSAQTSDLGGRGERVDVGDSGTSETLCPSG